MSLIFIAGTIIFAILGVKYLFAQSYETFDRKIFTLVVGILLWFGFLIWLEPWSAWFETSFNNIPSSKELANSSFINDSQTECKICSKRWDGSPESYNNLPFECKKYLPGDLYKCK